jgi:AcrR family transcriptional regulator
MDERIKTLRSLEPVNSGRRSYVAILEAAGGLFGQFSAQDIALRDILSISGVSNQTLYNYFPNGRDDIAIALYDRFQRTMTDDFCRNIKSIKFNEMTENSVIVSSLSACLARAVFGFLRTTITLQSTLFDYLKAHNLLCQASHVDELEEAMFEVLSQPLGHRFSKAALPRLARLSVHIVRGIADQAMANKAFSLDELESNARKVVRTLLRTGLQDQDGPSASHAFLDYDTGPVAILGAPLSPTKKQSILDRILKRKRPGSA